MIIEKKKQSNVGLVKIYSLVILLMSSMISNVSLGMEKPWIKDPDNWEKCPRDRTTEYIIVRWKSNDGRVGLDIRNRKKGERPDGSQIKAGSERTMIIPIPYLDINKTRVLLDEKGNDSGLIYVSYRSNGYRYRIKIYNINTGNEIKTKLIIAMPDQYDEDLYVLYENDEERLYKKTIKKEERGGYVSWPPEVGYLYNLKDPRDQDNLRMCDAVSYIRLNDGGYYLYAKDKNSKYWESMWCQPKSVCCTQRYKRKSIDPKKILRICTDKESPSPNKLLLYVEQNNKGKVGDLDTGEVKPAYIMTTEYEDDIYESLYINNPDGTCDWWDISNCNGKGERIAELKRSGMTQ